MAALCHTHTEVNHLPCHPFFRNVFPTANRIHPTTNDALLHCPQSFLYIGPPLRRGAIISNHWLPIAHLAAFPPSYSAFSRLLRTHTSNRLRKVPQPPFSFFLFWCKERRRGVLCWLRWLLLLSRRSLHVFFPPLSDAPRFLRLCNTVCCIFCRLRWHLHPLCTCFIPFISFCFSPNLFGWGLCLCTVLESSASVLFSEGMAAKGKTLEE